MANDPRLNNVTDDDDEEESREPGRRARGGGSRPRPRGGGGRFYRPRRRICDVDSIDWKDVDYLRRFLAPNGAIQGRRKTGACAKFQRRLAVAVKRARYMALLPYSSHHARLYRGGNSGS